MARRKRKTGPVLTDRLPSQAEEPKAFRAAGYARLSVEDGSRPGAEAIESQKRMLLDYIQETPGLELFDLFWDNGETGTDFRRPGFGSMMEAVRRGEINCIVVKDLSRFGRNYKETGNYLERIFPFLGIRFISINDRFDTLTAEGGSAGYIIPLKNLINEVYSRDISGKTASALRIKQQKGEFLGVWAPYGYRKSPEDKRKLVPDPDTASVVRRMFRLRLEGCSCQRIAGILNEEGISSPARRLAEAGLCRSEAYARSQWQAAAVRSILDSRVYLGHMVQGVKRQSFRDGRKQHRLPKEEWTIVENTHTPIIDADEFAAVQAMAQTARQGGRGGNTG